MGTWWAKTLVVSFALLAAIGVIALLRMKKWIAPILIGAVAGGIGGAMLYETAIVVTIGDIKSVVGLFASAVVCTAIGGFVAYKIRNMAIIHSTALIGAYFFMRGWSLLFGGFPSET